MLKAPRLLYDNTTNKLHHYLNAAYVRLGRVKKLGRGPKYLAKMAIP